MPKKTIAYLRTSKVAHEDVYREIPAKKEGEEPTQELVCERGEVNPETAVYTGPWWRDELEDWIRHTYDMNGGGNSLRKKTSQRTSSQRTFSSNQF